MTGRPLGFGRRAEDVTAAPGRVAVPEGATAMDDVTIGALLPTRDGRGHKGTFGKLLVLAGSLDYAGAALLVCRAAGRAGAGLVTLAVPESLQPLFAAKVVEATTMGLPEDDLEEVDPEPALTRILDHEHDALVIGPGLRPSLATAELLRLLLTVPEAGAVADDAAAGHPAAGDPAAADRPPADATRGTQGPPAVLDAEALRTLASADSWWAATTRRCILTPHAGEFARLRAGSGHDVEADGDLGRDDAARVAAARSAAAEWGQVVVLKGARTVVASPEGDVSVAPFENPALASGGTGDVLAGTIGALLAQGLDPYAAARVGVYLHGLAGEAVRERFGDAGLLASDLPEAVTLARKRLSAMSERSRKAGRLGFGARESSASREAAAAANVSDAGAGLP